MKKIEIKNGKIYTTSNLYERKDVFEIVEKIPETFFIWNIGENMGTDEYIPFAEYLKPDDKEDYQVNPQTLKAIKLSADEVSLLRIAAYCGVANKREAEKALKSKRNSHWSDCYWPDCKKEAAKLTIEIFKKITA